MLPLSTYFQDYPSLAGWDNASLWQGNLREAHTSLLKLSGRAVAEKAAAFLQSWLFVGCLESFLDKKVRISYLTLLDKNGDLMLWTRNLSICLRARVFDLRCRSESVKSELNVQIQRLVAAVHDWTSRFVAWSVPNFRDKMDIQYPAFMTLVSLITPAIVRLGEVLEVTRLHALLNLPTVGTKSWLYPYDVSERRRFQLLTRGWCPFTIEMLETTTNQSLLDWIIAKQENRNRVGHEKCQAQKCIRNHVDILTYKQAHATPNCSCGGELKAPTQAVKSCLNRNFIPTVISNYDDGIHTLEVRDVALVAQTAKYIAVSHVWADGMGGSTETGLPFCQGRLLQQYCSQILPEQQTVWWMDTLCVPSEQPYRNKAILQMRHVYQNAEAVLVVDKSIQQCSLSASLEEKLLAIYTSAWMQRLWTYQEAVLGKRLVFVMLDGLYDYEINARSTLPDMVNLVWRPLSSNLYRLRTDSEAINLGHIYTALRWRSTSRAEDEWLVVATLLRLKSLQHLESARLLYSVPEERPKLVLSELGRIPFDIPLLDGPKIQLPGFSWAPKTLMHKSRVGLDSDPLGSTSHCSDDGLIGDYLTVTLNRQLHGNRGKYGRNSGSTSIFVVGVLEDERHQTPQDETQHSLLRLYCDEHWPVHPATLPFDAVLLASENKQKPVPGRWIPAAAVRMVDRNDLENSTGRQVLKCDYVGRLLIESLRLDEASSKDESIMWGGASSSVVNARGSWGISTLLIR